MNEILSVIVVKPRRLGRGGCQEAMQHVIWEATEENISADDWEIFSGDKISG